MIVGLDHIAIAVPDLEKAITRFMDDFGLTFKGSEDVESAKNICFAVFIASHFQWQVR